MPAPFRYRKLGYVALNVTDVARTAAFVEDIVGLEPAGAGPSGERFFRLGPDHHSIALYQGAQPGYKRSAWELESEEDVERAFAHAQTLDLGPQWISHEERSVLGVGLAPAFRIREPTSGALLEYYSKMLQKSAPIKADLTRFDRLGHVVLNVTDCRATTDFFTQKLGFLVSDFCGDYGAALCRAFPNPYHHSIGIIQSRIGKAHFGHVNLTVMGIDDIGRMYHRLQRNQVQIACGIGRHPQCGAIFLYFLDPDGLTWEYSFGMELFPEHGAREPRYTSVLPEDFDLWGAVPTPELNAGGVIEAAG
jgi:2,3-dihydroxy-p-cumate/2,3-dihydroxybenzoate 3,4-dioxygenase